MTKRASSFSSSVFLLAIYVDGDYINKVMA